MKHSNRIDVVIIGAGIAGLVLAALLAKHSENLRIKILESNKSSITWSKSIFDKRVYAISRSSQVVFDYLGIWQDIISRRISPYRKMQIFNDSESRINFGTLNFESSEIGEPDLGNIVEDSLIKERLFNLLERLGNVSIDFNQKIELIENKDKYIEISTSSGDKFRSGLLVGADGVNSSVRSLSSIAIKRHLFDQYSIVTNIITEKPHNETAYQFFLENGPLAFLPLKDNRVSIVLSTSKEQAIHLYESSEKYFCKLLTGFSNKLLGNVLSCDSKKYFPLCSFNAKRYFVNRTVLVGDAAHSVHPLAGQGINMGITDVVILSSILKKSLSAGLDIGELRILREYQRESRSNNIKYIFAINSLYDIFKQSSNRSKLIKSLGMFTLNRSSYAKNILMSMALGNRRDAKFNFF